MSKVDIMEIEKIDRDRSTGDNMDGEKRANDKLDSMMVKLNKVEQRAYDNLKAAVKAAGPDILNDAQKEQLKKLEEKRKQ